MPDEEFRRSFIGARAIARGSENKTQVPLLGSPGGDVVVGWFLKWGENRDGSAGCAGGAA